MADSSKPIVVELSIEFVVELLLFLYPYGAEQMNLPHNFWLGLGSWVIGMVIAVRMFWIFPLWTHRLSPLNRGLIALIFVAGFIVAFYRPVMVAYSRRNGEVKVKPKQPVESAPEKTPPAANPPLQNKGKSNKKISSSKSAPAVSASGDSSTAAGSITQGPGSALSFNQEGGITAGQVNIGNPARHLSESDIQGLKSKLSGFRLKITIGVAVNVPDGFQLANELQAAIRDAGVSVADDIPTRIPGTGAKVLYGAQLQYHSDPLPLGAPIPYYSDSQLGILAAALESAHIPVASMHPDLGQPEATIEVIIGFNPAERH